MRKILTKNSAFTLAEVVISLGITGVLIIGTMQLADMTSKAGKEDELVNARRTIEQLMNNQKICKATILDKDLTTAGTPISAIKGLGGEKYFESSGADTSIDNALSGNATAENALNRSHIKYGKSVMVGKMLIKDKGEITDRQQVETAGVSSIKGKKVLRLLEFSVLLAIKNSRAKAGSKVKGYNKSITFTGVVDTTVSPKKIKSCVADVSFGQKEAERALCIDMGGAAAWDDIVGICKRETVKRTVAIETIKKLCDATEGIKGTYDATTNSCTPNYWGKNCQFCGLNFRVKSIGPQGEVTCTNGTNDCSVNDCVLKADGTSGCSSAEPQGGCGSLPILSQGPCTVNERESPSGSGICLPSCGEAARRASVGPIEGKDYLLICASSCSASIYGDKKWENFSGNSKAYEIVGRNAVCCKRK